MFLIEEVIVVVDVIDIEVVVVAPILRPRFRILKPVASILEARLAFDADIAAATPRNVETMFVAEAGAETIFRDTTTAPVLAIFTRGSIRFGRTIAIFPRRLCRAPLVVLTRAVLLGSRAIILTSTVVGPS